ncbi:pyridoxal phosphate-dependent aminotransferase [Blautia producta]|uniref:Threonine-phosphate decarboxylase n=1 Tax=Blautia producta TaxID=33035 RepID=A0A4P6M217_9FIRM|nr:threonine-phosphate decarboxylase [Blautia producta]QBE98689.1 Threonine-phosphate decarboxylase [Blautia producta]
MISYHAHGGDVYRHQNVTDFSANCNPFGTPESVKQAVARAMEQVCHYPDVKCERLREAISHYEGVPAEQIICGNGAADLIFALVLALKPKKALLPAPTFAEYEQALATVDCEMKRYVLKEDTGFFVGRDFLECITEELDIVFLCNPNNPTGVLMEQDFLEEVLFRCQKCGCILMLDECFVDFVEYPKEHTMKPFLEQNPGLFLLKAFTKRYAMAGVRLGYALCGNGPLLEKMQLVTQPWNVSVLAQEAGIAALSEKEYVERSMEAIHRERTRLLKSMGHLRYQTFASSANYIFFKGPENLYEQCLERGILIRDCSNYYGLSKGYYRIAVRLREENNRLLQVLEEIQALDSREE